MPFSYHLRQFVRNLNHPRVLFFLILGTAIIFLTFLTTNDALEITISGIASVFIGIGVNNFSLIETANRKKSSREMKVDQALRTLSAAHLQMDQLMNAASMNGPQAKLAHSADDLLLLSMEILEEARRND